MRISDGISDVCSSDLWSPRICGRASPCLKASNAAAIAELFISALVTFLVVIDPPGCAPIFASLTAGAPAAHRRSMALRSVGIAAALLFAFALFGKAFLGALGVSLDAFRFAGGIMLFLIALEMVFEKRTQRREDRAEAGARDAPARQRAWEAIDRQSVV